MRNLKKFLALVLAMMMAFSLMVTANAASDNVTYPDSDIVLDQFEDAVTVLSGMGVLRGNNGSFKPQDKIMRCEAVAILYRLVTSDVKDTQVDLYKPLATSFSDVKETDWFAGYVGFAVDAKLINGYNGKFMPYENVTGYEMLKMLLKAVGYGQNGEYTGSLWRINVGSDAQRLGILTNINSTHYANTLAQKSPREVVADLTFQTAAYVPTVRYELGYYNPWVGVASGQGGNIPNPTLGQREFGLTRQTGIVVGNQATGELYTKVGASAKGIWTGSTPTLTGVELTQSGSYYYYTSDGAGTDNPNAATTATAPNGNVTVSFNFGTGLEYFGHKVDTWYDSRTASGTQTFDGVAGVTTTERYTKTYAILDKANLVKTVWAEDLSVEATGAAAAAPKTSVYSAAVAQGFSTLSDPAWASDRFAQMNEDDDNDALQSKVGMYTVISNNSSLTADVVISLNQEVADITQRNTTITDGEYIYLGTGSSKFGAVLNGAASGKLLDALLAPGSDVTLGDLVTANEVVGTAIVPSNIVAGDAIAQHAPAKDALSTLDTKYCRYDTAKLEPAFTGTIATYTLVNKADPSTRVVNVTLSDSKSYDLSGITGADINTAPYLWNFDTATHLIDGALTTLTGQNTSAGVTYTFYTDAVGRFIGVGIPNDYKFLYTTFADYEIGGLGTGTSGYYVYGVDWNGNIVKDKQIVSITEPVDVTNAPYEFDDLTTDGDLKRYPNATDSLAVGYNYLPVTLKDLGNATSGTVGNQVRAGVNTRFMVNPNGNMTWYPQGSEFGERFLGWWDASAGVAGAASYTWTITAQDAANGFKRVYNRGVAITDPCTAISAPVAGDATTQTDYLLTDSTKFIVVTGSGTADLSVKTYNGIKELVGDASYAEISIASTFNGDNVYFITSAQKYGNVNEANNHTIDTVILSNTNLNNFTNQNLFFSKPGNTATGVKLAGDPGIYGTVNQYELYNNGVKGYYWVSDTQSTGNAANANTANGTTKKGDFYTLTPIGEVNGQPIYKATVQAYGLNGRICDVDELYDYIVVNDLSTAAFGGTTAVGHPGNVVKKVTGAKVTVVLGDNDDATFQGLFPNGINITDLQTLNNAVSMGKAGAAGNLYDISVAFEYSGVNVTNIYVTNVANHT